MTARKRAPPRFAGWISDDDWSHRATAAFQRGAEVKRPFVVEWDASGRCEQPVFRTLKGSPTTFWGRSVMRSDTAPTRYLDMWVPCRKCRTCLRRKAFHWKQRAMTEITKAAKTGGRTWFITLTFSPLFRSRILMTAQRRYPGEEWSALSQEQRSQTLAEEAQSYVTLWMKRVRSQSGSALRYLSVTELHKDGMPHCHLLVTECGDVPLRHAVISGQWRYGFSNAKLIDPDDPRAAEYATKYLSKSPISRVRASVGYGHEGA